MAINAYENCPCGSGKKFKWCCTPYFDKIELALDQQQKGQHDGAVRTMQDVTREHASAPQVWCYYANILAAEGKSDEAEEALQKALSIQPDFAMANMLRGYFRLNEGEVIGALLLFRKAAEAYSPEAATQLANVYELIARQESALHHPVAARMALERAANYSPADGELRQQLELVFGERSRLPAAAKKKYSFRSTGKPLPAGADSGKLSDARKALEAIVTHFPNDPAAHFNLGLLRAWLGENGPAITSLTTSLDLEADDFKAEETGALIEVLKCAPGTVEESDFQGHSVLLPIRDGEAVIGLLQSWESQGRLIGTQVDQQNGVLTSMIVEAIPNLLDTGTTLGKVVASLTMAQGFLRLDHPSKESVESIAQSVRDALTLAVGEPMPHLEPLDFSDVVIEAVAYPIRGASNEEVEKKMSAYSENYMQNVLPNKPFKVLSGVNPVDAVGSKTLRKKLLGLLRFLEDCFTAASPKKRDGDTITEVVKFDFNKLRQKIGLELSAADAPATVAAADKKDFAGMSLADLGTLNREALSTAELEEAMKAAIRLQAHELAVAFALTGAARPIDAEKPDRYPFYACMMTGAVVLNKPEEALTALRDGRAWDASHNGGARANEYGLRTAALLAKMNRLEESTEAFDEVIDRNTSDGNLYVKAAETMLSIKSGAKARYFAEKGLAKAKTIGNRDLQGACEELLAAAKKMM